MAGKLIKVDYKIERGSKIRVGQLVVCASTNGVSYDDTYNENTLDVGVILSAVLDNKDSTAGSETIIVKYITTNDVSATMEYQTTIMV